MSLYQPKKSDRFTFGLWTVANRGRDPFGEAVREAVTPIRAVQELSKLGAYGVNLHDNDLVPIDAAPSERTRIITEFKKVLADHDMKVPMATTNLFYDPIFKDGAFTSNDAKIRAYAVQKAMRGIDVGVELNAEIYVFWGGREGTEVESSKNPVEALKWMRECLNFLIGYCKDNRYPLKFALEAKPNEPRGDLYLSTTGAMLAFIETLDDPAMVGVNPEVAHETMAGLNFVHAVAQAIDRGKLFHIDLNGQKMSRFDQDLRFGSEDIKTAFMLVKLLEDSGYQGSRHFDAHPYRTEDDAGVWDFAAGCMRTYLILKEKVHRFNQDEEIQAILRNLTADPEKIGSSLHAYSKANATRVGGLAIDRIATGKRGYGYEKLDQLTMEIIMGVR